MRCWSSVTSCRAVPFPPEQPFPEVDLLASWSLRAQMMNAKTLSIMNIDGNRRAWRIGDRSSEHSSLKAYFNSCSAQSTQKDVLLIGSSIYQYTTNCHHSTFLIVCQVCSHVYMSSCPAFLTSIQNASNTIQSVNFVKRSRTSIYVLLYICTFDLCTMFF
jgi:hypothetical protein